MRISVTRGSWLVPLLALMPLVQGCNHKTQPPAQSQTLAPPIDDAPPPKPAPVTPADLPPPVIGPPQDDQTAAKDTAPKPPPPAKKPVHHPKSTTPAGNTPPPQQQQPVQEAANSTAAPAPSVSAIGELSGGASGDQRSQTEEMINTTEKGVNAINRSLNDSETKTAAQIREFLKQARQALTSGDVDGALTLAKKAKVLLAELNNQ